MLENATAGKGKRIILLFKSHSLSLSPGLRLKLRLKLRGNEL